MANENHPKVKIISDCFVKPKSEINLSKTPYYLSSKDLCHLSTTYMYRGLLYAKPSPLSSSSTSFNINSFVDNLKQSLSLALVDFYPLSGRLETVTYPEDHSSWVYVDCNKGPGARFIHAILVQQGVLTLSNIVMRHESIPRFLWCLFDAGDPNVLNYDGHTRALVTVQVTDLVDGVFIGFTMNHSLADGTSLWCFLNNLSNIFMSRINNNNNNNVDDHYSNNIEKPIFKSVFSDGYGPILKIPYLDPSEFIVRLEKHPRLRTRVFHLSAEAIARIKARANEKSNGIIISSFQALAAFTWISITRARNQPDDSIAMCLIPATTRPKFDPPLPSNHFGNFANSVTSTSKVDDLLRNGLGWASTALREAIMGQDSAVVRASLKSRDKSPQVVQITKMYEFFGDYPPLLITSTMRFDTYGPEFGLGKPVASRPGNSNAVHGLIVADPSREGGGCVDLNVCLLSKVIDVLECDQEFMSYVS